MQTASGKKIVLPAPRTSTVNASAEDLHLIRMGSLQRGVSAFSCCSSPLMVTEERNSRKWLVSKLSISFVFVSSLLPSLTHYSKKNLEVNSKPVLLWELLTRQGVLWRLSLASWVCYLPSHSQPTLLTTRSCLLSPRRRERPPVLLLLLSFAKTYMRMILWTLLSLFSNAPLINGFTFNGCVCVFTSSLQLVYEWWN